MRFIRSGVPSISKRRLADRLKKLYPRERKNKQKDIKLQVILCILILLLFFILIPGLWPFYMIIAVGIAVYYIDFINKMKKERIERFSQYDKIKEKSNLNQLTDDEIFEIANSNNEFARLALAEILRENFDKFHGSKIIEKLADDEFVNVRFLALQTFRLKFSKFMNPSEILFKFFNARGWKYVDLAMNIRTMPAGVSFDEYFSEICRILRENFAQISNPEIIISDLIDEGGINDHYYFILIQVLRENFGKIKGAEIFANKFIEETLSIKAEDESNYKDSLILIAKIIEENYSEIENSLSFVEKFSRSFGDEDVNFAVAKIVEKNYEKISNLDKILENLAYSRNEDVRSIVKKLLKKDMKNYEKIMKILEI